MDEFTLSDLDSSYEVFLQVEPIPADLTLALEQLLSARQRASADDCDSPVSKLLSSTKASRLRISSQTNVQIFHAVLDLQAWIKQIPGQVSHQQPVLFLDALGRRQQFHLDFVQSADV